ncbi:transporter substrate-binding domain-containing protein [Variovorax sp. OV329]|uniref:transporter substrate-binding domain-containing protein n=1 Tax=Variovorax sp. OV329 TaxID=1882825 RepID=UPI0008EDF639|nr:transporter substrate-binding domain-containing protein [Variovorax sp. OV329]SFN21491.1 amino acid ABC transporter substrate-binding protein, PAAT family [Variovorax sp. OV329]
MTRIALPRRGIALAGALALLLLCALAATQVPAASALARRVLPAPPAASLPVGPLLERAMQRGLLVVGVRSYARPAPPGAPTPAEPDSYDVAVAQGLADRLGLRLQLVGLASASQDAALHEGIVDLVVAGTLDAPAGQGTALADGDYDSTPGMLVGLRSGRVRGTDDLAGQPVCVVQGSGLARTLVRRYEAAPRAYPSSVHAASAFMAGECQALADHADVLERLLRNDEWRFYRAIARGLAPEGDAVVRLAAGDERSREWVGAALREWQRSGEQDRARSARVGNVQFEVGLLKDGLVCHS